MHRTFRASAADDEDGSIAEAEMAKLKRLYLAAEGERKAYADETTATLRKQAQILEKLEADNAHLKSELAAAEGQALEEDQVSKKLAAMRTKIDGYQAEIEVEQDTIKDLDSALRKAEKEIKRRELEQRKASGGTEESARAIQHHITTQENRLQKALTKYNDTLTKNAKLREVIDHLKQERNQFDTIYKKLERQLQSQKRQMAEIIESSNQAYEARDEAQAKMSALKEKNEKEIMQSNMELKELTRVLEHDRKLKSFMGVKSQDRAKGFNATRRKAAMGGEDNPEATMQSYEEAFAQIKEATGIQETDKLVDRFIAVEDQNFSLFNYVNELNNEIETLREKIAEVKGNIGKFNEQGQAMDQQRKKTLRELEEKLASTESEAATIAEKQQATQEELNALKTGIDEVFNKIGCDKSGIASMLGNAGVTEANIMQYLGVIEQRANELLHMRTLLDTKATNDWEKKEIELLAQTEDDSAFDPTATLGPKPEAQGLLGTGPQPQLGVISIQPPSTGDDYESDAGLSDGEVDDQARPLTQAELRAKIAKGMSKREAKGSSKSKDTRKR